MLNLSDLFASYSVEAFRLELLQQYIVPNGEWENFLHYRETGEPRQHEGLVKYIQAGNEKISKGIRHIRARIVLEPISDYIIFETKIGYIPQAKNGFEINILNMDEYNLLLSNLNINTETISDFWLFDKSIVALMEYDNEGRYLGHKITDDEAIVEVCLKIRNEIIKKSHSLSYILDKYQIAL